MKHSVMILGLAIFLPLGGLETTLVEGSSHMDAPLITLDDAANTTDVYAFRSESGGTQYLTTAVAVYPFQEPGSGPNYFTLDDNALYEIHVALGDDLQQGKPTISYQFKFHTEFQNPNTILPLTGPVTNVGGSNQNLRQTYTVTKLNHRTREETVLSEGLTTMPTVPPNNQGNLTSEYQATTPNSNRGDNPAQSGATTHEELDKYTKQAIANLLNGYRSFAGQRDDGFYADMQAIYDRDNTFGGPNKPFDSQKGFNAHTIVLDIPLSELAPHTDAGVWAAISRQKRLVLSMRPEDREDTIGGAFIQVARQGNPLFNQGMVPLVDKDLYSRTDPSRDSELFDKYVDNPEIVNLLGIPVPNSTALREIFIPDLIKVALDTGSARLPGQTGFSRLSHFGSDVLERSSGGSVPGGWPNGRRPGDDVLDILYGVSHPGSVPASLNVDGVPANDQIYNQVFPFLGTPLNGRHHLHD